MPAPARRAGPAPVIGSRVVGRPLRPDLLVEAAVPCAAVAARPPRRRGAWRRTLWVVLLAGVLVQMAARAASAQSTLSPPTAADEPFLAVDVFGGTHPQASTAASTAPNPPPSTFGWEIAGTVRPRRWFGISAAIGRVRTPERAWIDHAQAGPRVSTPLGRVTDLRAFAHILAGRAKSRQPNGATATSLELMAGGGVDVFNVFRFQLDLVRRDLPTFPRTDSRFLFGVAIPLCFRGCGPSDGFRVR